MRRMFLAELRGDEVTVDGRWTFKQRNQVNRVVFRSGKLSKVQGAGLPRCAECGGEVKVLVSPKRNPHSSKLGRAVSMKDHDLCRRCWRRLIQQHREGVILKFDPTRRLGLMKTELKKKSLGYGELPKTG